MNHYRALFDMLPFDQAVERIREEAFASRPGGYVMLNGPAKVERLYQHRNGETEPPTVPGWFGVEFMDYDKPVQTVVLLSEDRLGVRESWTGVRVDSGRYKGARWWGPWMPWEDEVTP